MTKESKYSSKTQFSDWLRKQKELDSSDGFVTTDLDYIWENYKSGKWMFIEEKRGITITSTRPQRRIFKRLHNLCRKDKMYKGFHEVCFSETNPDDGKIYINNIEVTKEDLIKFLKFELTWKK